MNKRGGPKHLIPDGKHVAKIAIRIANPVDFRYSMVRVMEGWGNDYSFNDSQDGFQRQIPVENTIPGDQAVR